MHKLITTVSCLYFTQERSFYTIILIPTEERSQKVFYIIYALLSYYRGYNNTFVEAFLFKSLNFCQISYENTRNLIQMVPGCFEFLWIN